VFRSLVEIWRDDDRGVLFGWLSTSQILSLPLVRWGS
jgi:prolipoprotein diacylglyceryltransferase